MTISTLGSQVSAFAIPLLAAISLHANAFQMGLLRAAEFAPFLIFTLPAGVWADFGIRRRLMISTNLVQGSMILLIPLCVALGWMKIEVLYGIMFIMGSLKVIFEMSYQTYIPEIVNHANLIRANSKIMMSYALGQSAGPGLAGIMVEILGAPLAILVDSLGYFSCAAFISKISHRERRVRAGETNLYQQILRGFKYVHRQPHIRGLAFVFSTNNFCVNAIMALLVLYATRELGIRPGLFGMTVTFGGLGAIFGASLSKRFGDRFGPGPWVIIATMGLALGALCFPLLGPGQPGGLLCLAAGYFILSAAGSALTVYAWTIRQFLTPNHLLGKMNGAFRFWVTGVMPLGALFGGWLGSQIGIRSTLALAAIGIVASSFVGVFSALRKLRVLVPVSQPEPFR